MRYHKFPRLYVEGVLAEKGNIKLSKPQSHYLVSVMRRKLSDKVILFNGKDGEFLAEIIEANKNSVGVKIVEKTRELISPTDIRLICSPVKNVKDEFIVQKATELGVSNIQPCVFERTIKPKIKEDKLRLVAIEAAEQCERLDVPEILPLKDFSKLIKEIENSIIIFCDETGQGKPANIALKEIKEPNAPIYVVIGPEGGFSDSEIKKIYSLKNTFGIGMGPRILRADTAVITALSLVQNYLGDFNLLPEFRNSTI